MTYTAENPHADGSTVPGARPRYPPPRHIDLPDTSRTHDNWKAARQMSCRQQTAPPQPRCSKDITAHTYRPGARPDSPCPVPAAAGSHSLAGADSAPHSEQNFVLDSLRTRYFLSGADTCLSHTAGTGAALRCCPGGKIRQCRCTSCLHLRGTTVSFQDRLGKLSTIMDVN